MRAIWLAVALVATPVMAAEQSQQFDLVCTAKRESDRLRIDLARGEWCFGACERVMKIQEVTAGLITLHDEKPSPPDNIRAYQTINRLTGEWQWYNYTPRYRSIMDIKGVCAPASFSGFPTAKF
jgi:hypothetical protein